MSVRTRAATVLAVLPVALAGCAAGHGAGGQAGAGAQAVGPSMHRMPDGTLMNDAAMAGATATAGAASPSPASAPSSSAAMICAGETHQALQHNLGLSRPPASTDRWAGGLYTCSYHLSGGDLVASVHDAATPAAGQRYFDAVRARTPGLSQIQGLPNFGLPGYEDGHGVVLFLKDGKTLEIDASGLPASVGAYHQSPADVAYGLAASILACWSEH